MQRMAEAINLCSASSSYVAQLDATEREIHKFAPACNLDADFNGGFGRCEEYQWSRIVTVGQECTWTTSWESLSCSGPAGAGKDPRSEAPEAVAERCPEALREQSADTRALVGYNLTIPLERCTGRAPDSLVCLSNLATNDMMFDQLSTYGNKAFSDALCCIALVALVFYFVTSSDSGSFVVDIISGNGVLDPPVFQRIFWSVTEGATACALLAAGRNLPNASGSLKALQAASMVTGLPYTFVLCWCCQSLLLLVWEESGELAIDRKAFNTFIFNFRKPMNLLVAFVLPSHGLGMCVQTAGDWPLSGFANGGKFWGIALQILYLVALWNLAAGILVDRHYVAWGLSTYLGFGLFVGVLRTSIRGKYDIKHGDMITDIICGIVVPWFTIAQMVDQIQTPVQLLEDRETGCAGLYYEDDPDAAMGTTKLSEEKYAKTPLRNMDDEETAAGPFGQQREQAGLVEPRAGAGPAPQTFGAPMAPDGDVVGTSAGEAESNMPRARLQLDDNNEKNEVSAPVATQEVLLKLDDGPDEKPTPETLGAQREASPTAIPAVSASSSQPQRRRVVEVQSQDCFCGAFTSPTRSKGLKGVVARS